MGRLWIYPIFRFPIISKSDFPILISDSDFFTIKRRRNTRFVLHSILYWKWLIDQSNYIQIRSHLSQCISIQIVAFLSYRYFKFLLRNKIFSTLSGESLDLKSLNVCPAVLNSRSEAAEDAGAHKYLRTSCFRFSSEWTPTNKIQLCIALELNGEFRRIKRY